MARAMNYTSSEQAMKISADTIRQHLPLIPGVRDPGEVEHAMARGDDYLNITWDRAWGAGCTLSLSTHAVSTETTDEHIVKHRKLRVEISWSSTGRGPADAIAACALYQQVAQLGCLLESVVGRLHIANLSVR